MILGLDISTSYIGWCILNNKKCIDVGYLDLRKHKTLYEKLKIFEDFLPRFSRLTDVFVEAPLARSNNQNVVNLLQRWNGMCCAALFLYFRKPPTLVEQRLILKEQDIKIPKGVKGVDRKRFILNHVKSQNHIPDSKWENKKTGVPKDFCYDMADAYVVATAGLMHEKEKISSEEKSQ